MSGETKVRALARGTSLNPNAAEFVPLSLRPSPANTASSGKQILDRSESSISDDEARQYWQQHLPDDITPDFNLVSDDDSASLSLSSLSLHTPGTINPHPDLANQHTNNDPSSTSYHPMTTKPWDFTQTIPNPNHHEPATNQLNPFEFLASHFPGFAVESLAEVYFANACDLNLTIDMLTQLELQVEGASNQNMNVNTISPPNLTSVDFPSLPVPDTKTVHPYASFDKDNLLMFRSGSSLSAKTSTDFASAVRKLASQDSGFWKYDRNGSPDPAIGSSRSSQALTGLYSTGASRSLYSDRNQGRASARAAPVWLDTGDAVANLYSDVREEARERARIRNTYFEQARQAYLIGNKALAKELSMKGHLHNMQMKAAHSKAGESIYRERNPVSPGLQGTGRSQEKMIDLHGLHVSEAIHVLKQELGVLRNAARLADQRLHVYICVGTGHHTRGSRTPARLPIAVQRYLLEEEGLEYSEPQPGLLRVVLY